MGEQMSELTTTAETVQLICELAIYAGLFGVALMSLVATKKGK